MGEGRLRDGWRACLHSVSERRAGRLRRVSDRQRPASGCPAPVAALLPLLLFPRGLPLLPPYCSSLLGGPPPLPHYSPRGAAAPIPQRSSAGTTRSTTRTRRCASLGSLHHYPIARHGGANAPVHPSFLRRDYKEYHTDTTVRFVVKLSEERLRKVQAEGLHRFFKLHSFLSINTMVLFDARGCIKRYASVLQIMEEFHAVRADFYVQRKVYLEGVLAAESLKLDNQARFICEKIDGVIVIGERRRRRRWRWRGWAASGARARGRGPVSRMITPLTGLDWCRQEMPSLVKIYWA